MRRALVIAAALVAALLAASVVLFLRPAEDEARVVDAVVVLGGDAAYRIPAGRRLVGAGTGDELVLSREPGERWDRWRPLCRESGVTCFDADPYSTQGEAQAVARLAEEHGWRSLAVVTSRYHVFRTRLLFRRCLGGRVAVLGAGYDRRWLPLILPLESAKLVRAVIVERDC